MAVISNRHATRLLFQRLSKPSADYARLAHVTVIEVGLSRLSRSVRASLLKSIVQAVRRGAGLSLP